MSERFKVMSKKYMCTWMPEEALSVCTTKAEVSIMNESPSDIDCLLCVSKALISIGDCLWTARLLPPQTLQTIEFLDDLRVSYEHIKIAFNVMSKKFKPSFCTKSEETWANNVETLLSKLKEEKASE